MIVVCFLLMFAMQNVFANGMTDGVDISNKEYNPSVEFKKVARQPDTRRGDRLNYLYLKKDIPFCGVSEAGVYYIDLTSCNYFIEDGVAYVNCIVYAGSGGADAYGNPGKVAKSTYRFSTYKNQGERYIRLLSCVDNNGRNITNEEYENDNGFLLSIFWKAADRVGISQYLD